MTKTTPHAVDTFAGSQIRIVRTLIGYSQSDLAEQIGITSQQVQKYENGSNRVSLSMAWMIANALNVSPISFFPKGDNRVVDEFSLNRQQIILLRNFGKMTPEEKTICAAMISLMANKAGK